MMSGMAYFQTSPKLASRVARSLSGDDVVCDSEDRLSAGVAFSDGAWMDDSGFCAGSELVCSTDICFVIFQIGMVLLDGVRKSRAVRSVLELVCSKGSRVFLRTRVIPEEAFYGVSSGFAVTQLSYCSVWDNGTGFMGLIMGSGFGMVLEL